MNFAKKIFSEKAPLPNVRLGSKYVLASGRYWKGKLIVDKKKVINFNLETSGKKIVIVLRGIFRTQPNPKNS